MRVVEDLIRQAEVERGDRDRPLVTLSYAQSIDGSIARRRGEPLTLSGSASMKITHQLRAIHDGILVGIGTVQADDPKLTVRHVTGDDPQAIILDSRLRFPPNARLLSNQKPPWLFASASADSSTQSELEQYGCRTFRVAGTEKGELHLNEVLQTLNTQGIKRLMVEGGASVITSFLSSGLADVAVITIAPFFVGGFKAVESLVEVQRAKFPRLSPFFIDKAGDDVLLWGRF